MTNEHLKRLGSTTEGLRQKGEGKQYVTLFTIHSVGEKAIAKTVNDEREPSFCKDKRKEKQIREVPTKGLGKRERRREYTNTYFSFFT